MSQFEVVTITLSFVLGLSMTHILWSAASAVRARKELQLDWLPFAWAACIFLLHVQFWFGALSVDLGIERWTWGWYLTSLFKAILLFASGALVLPTESKQRLGSLFDDFQEHGRLSLIPLALYCWSNVPESAALGTSIFVLGNITVFSLGVIALTAFFIRRSAIERGSVLLFAVVETLSMIFLWSRNAMT